MSVPEKVLMRKIKKREKTKLTVLKQREEQKDLIRPEKITETSQQNTEDIPPKKKMKLKVSEKSENSEIAKQPLATENLSGTTIGFEVMNDTSFSVLSEKVCENTLKAIKDMGFTNMTEIQTKELFHPFWKEEIWYRLHNYVSHERIIYANFLGVLKELMKYHYHTYGLLMSGANRQTEAQKLRKGINVIVATSGRLLDHLQNTPDFLYKNFKCLVIDEADRILDIGYEEALKQIINILPKHRQTMVFSATQMQRVAMITTLALKKEPIYMEVDDDKDIATVKDRQQDYSRIILRVRARKDFYFCSRS